ncbi:retrovirus-related Pol polyprotein from transposon 17.6 [Trichonephila clavipes]|nr:retrovirus-related Pol polyprotein from transposon 17.6 [Trichonephila clavipes]
MICTITAAMIRETPGIFEHVSQSMSGRYRTWIQANGEKTDFEQLKQALTKSLRFVRNRAEYLSRETQGPSNNIGRRDLDACERFSDERESGNWRDAEVIEGQNDWRGLNRSAYGNRSQENNVNQRIKQEIIDYRMDKKIREGTIIPIQSPFASPVVLCRKNNGLPPDNPEAYRFAVDYCKLNAIARYRRYTMPLIEDLIGNIPHTEIMNSLDLRCGYFQLAINPSDVVKTILVTKNDT